MGFLATDGGLLLGIFAVNPTAQHRAPSHRCRFVIAGLSGVRAAKTINATIGAAYLLLGVVGFLPRRHSANISR